MSLKHPVRLDPTYTYFSQQLLTVTSAFSKPFVTISFAASYMVSFISLPQLSAKSLLHIVSI